MKTFERRVGACLVTLAGTVRGLTREVTEVEALIDEARPEAIVLAIGPRERAETDQVLKERGEMPGAEGNRPAGQRVRHGPTGLPDETIKRDFSEDETDVDDIGLFLSASDMVFMRHLARWGEVEAPPPSYREALRLGYVRGIPVVAGDFDDEGYTDVFLANVAYMSLVRQGMRLKKLAKRKFRSSNAEEFVLEWDRALTRTKGYGAIERAREQKVAGAIGAEAKQRTRVLAIVDLERMPGVLGVLDAPAPSPPAPA